MCDFDETVKENIELTLKDHYGYGQESVAQFMLLESEAIFRAFSQLLADKEKSYRDIIGDVEL